MHGPSTIVAYLPIPDRRRDVEQSLGIQERDPGESHNLYLAEPIPVASAGAFFSVRVDTLRAGKSEKEGS